jgi:hypothetical protein
LVVVVRVEVVLVSLEAPSFLVAAAAARFFSLASPIDVQYRVQPFLFVY